MKPYYKTEFGTIYNGDSLEILKQLPDESVNCCVTSPPYWGLRDYGEPGQLGLEETPEEYVLKMVEIFREIKRVLRDDGTLWLNIGDSYTAGGMGNGMKECKQQTNAGSIGFDIKKPPPGMKPKNLVGIPWRVAFALQSEGWYLRQDIIWSKNNPMPESVKDRCTKSHEYIFLLSKSQKYYFDADAIKEKACTTDTSKRDRDNTKLNNTPGRTKMGGLKTNHYTTRNKRSVWTVNTKPFKKAHFATFPQALIEPCILAGCPEGGIVLDPFFGSGTTGIVAHKHDRKFIGIELNRQYVDDIAIPRIENETRQLKLF